MTNELMLDASWKWLPKTALFVNVRGGDITFFQEGRSTSAPLRATAGLRGLITNKLALNLAAGYGNGFYSNGRGPSGLGNLQVSLEAVYRPTIETTAVLGYRHDFQNAILADFYDLDAVYLNLSQAIAGRVGFGLSARYESRGFHGVQLMPNMFDSTVSRHDNYWQAGVNLDYHLQAWSYIGVSYTLMKNDSDQFQTGTNVAPPIYTKQLFFARLGVVY